MLLWIAITNAVTNGITGLIIGMFMYYYGKRQGEKSKELLKNEINSYIENDLFKKLSEVIQKKVSDATKGVWGPYAKSVHGETPQAVMSWAKENPGMLPMLMGIFKSALVNRLAKDMGLPKEVKDYLKLYSQGMITNAGPNDVGPAMVDITSSTSDPVNNDNVMPESVRKILGNMK